MAVGAQQPAEAARHYIMMIIITVHHQKHDAQKKENDNDKLIIAEVHRCVRNLDRCRSGNGPVPVQRVRYGHEKKQCRAMEHPNV